jgi:hypothetical protein
MKYQFASDFAESRGWRAAVVDDLTAHPSKNSATGLKLPSSACVQCRGNSAAKPEDPQNI